MTPDEFFAAALPWAIYAHAATGVATSVILAQWADETGFGGPDWEPNNNPGNVGSFNGKPVATFPSMGEGVAAYIQTLNDPDYAPVRKAVGAKAQCVALGVSPWADPPYILQGVNLWTLVQQYDLTQYDGAQKPPMPVPSIMVGDMDDATFVRWCYYEFLIQDPDAAGYKNNVDFLTAGGSRNDLMTSFIDSPRGQAVMQGRCKDTGVPFVG
jgi:flagellum-specific peptidoglycan hydrolase FlgJ